MADGQRWRLEIGSVVCWFDSLRRSRSCDEGGDVRVARAAEGLEEKAVLRAALSHASSQALLRAA